jgi:hypothetical protein
MIREAEQNLVEILNVEGIRYDRHGIARVKVPVKYEQPQTIELSVLPHAKHAWFANLADWNVTVVISSNDTNLLFQSASAEKNGEVSLGQRLDFNPEETTALEVNFGYPQRTVDPRNGQLLPYYPTLTTINGKK